MKRLSVLFAIMLLTVATILMLGSCHKFHIKHTPGKAVRENEISATCTSDGSYDEVIRCSGCDEELSRITKTLEKTGHNLSEFINDNNATCTQNATQTKSCKNPGCSYKETEEVPDSALNHESQMVEFSGEYCGDNPVAKVICGICQMLIAEYGHTYEKSVIPATCLENGKNVYTCKKCGDSYTETFPASGHISGTWVTVTPPTCTALGTAEKECMVCGEHYDSKKIEVLPHTYASKLTDNGMLYTCRECGYSYTDRVNLPIYHITFNENGGDEVEDMSVLEHSTPDIPITHRDGYIFTGWFVDEALTESYTGSTVESDLTLYAGWQEPEIIEDEEDIVTDAPTDYTFTVVSDTVLNDGNIGNYVSIKTLGGKSIKPRIVPKNDSAYTIGADYKNGENYFVTLTNISFEGKEAKELWIKTEGEKENEIVLKNGVTAVSLDDIFGIYENNKDMLMMAYNDILAVGNTYAFYEGADDAYRFGAKIKSKDALEGYTVYTAEFLTVDDIFEVCDLSESEKVNFNNAEINANLKSDIAAVFEKSPVYSQYKSAVQAVSKTYDSTVKGINLDVSFSTLGEKFLIKFSAVANLDSGVAFIMNYIIELKINFDFALNGSNSTLILNSNMKNTVELNVAFDGEEAHGTTAFNKAALLREYRSIFNEIKAKNMELSPENAQTKPDPKAFELATIPIQIGPVTAYIAIMGEFDFSMMGGLSTEFVQTVDCRIGMQNGKFAKDYKAKLEYFSGCGYTITDIYGGIGVKLDVGFCGLYGYIKGSIGVLGELSGAAAFAIADEKSFVLGNYHFTSEVIIDASVGVNYVIRVFGYQKVLLDESVSLVEKDIPFITLGDEFLTLHFTDDSYTSVDSPLDLGKISCGKTDVSDKIDTSVLVIDANTFKPSTHKLACEYVVRVTSGNVRAAISTKGILTLKGEGNFTLTVTVKHGDVVEKTIYVKGSADHDYSEEIVNNTTQRSAANCDSKATYFYTCSSCNTVSPDKYFESGEVRAHNLTDYEADDTKHWKECVFSDCDYVTEEAAHSGTEATCSTLSVCSTCGASFGEYAPHGYADLFTCHDRQCLTCTHIEPKTTKHSFVNEKCEYCGALDSSIGIAYTSNNDGTCYVSGIGTCASYDIVIPTKAPNGDKVIAIAQNAFRNCSDLTSIEIPDSVTSIGNSAFDGCSGLTSVVIPNSVTSIGGSAFYGCSGLTSVVIPDSVTKIGDSAFSGCSSLTSIEIPDSVTKIGSCAFYGCSGLTSVVIPDSVTSIGSSAFRGCSGLVSITIPFVGESENATKAESHFGYIFGYSSSSEPSSGYHYYYSYKICYFGVWITYNSYCTYHIPKSLKNVTISGKTTSIDSETFRNCDTLTSVVIGDGVTSIGSDAFYGCTGLTSVYITDIAAWCNINFNNYSANPLYYANNLYLNGELITELVIPDEVTIIPQYAFSCDNITSVKISSSVTSIGKGAFSGCTSLEKIYFNATAMSDLSSSNNVFYNAGKNGNGIKVVIGKNVTKIPAYLFYPYSISSYSPKITSVEFENGSVCKSIGSYAFEDCTRLTSIEIPDSVTSIGDDAFNSCYRLTSVVIPDSVTSIGKGAFSGCKLTSITVAYANTAYKSVDGNLYTKDGKTLVQYAIGKTDVSFTIPDGVTTICSYAFSRCTSLTSIVIPDSVTSIGYFAFSGCSGLTSIKYRGTKEQWNAISKGSYWNYGTGNYTITYNYDGE